jgi:hypothetical protein
VANVIVVFRNFASVPKNYKEITGINVSYICFFGA